MASIFANTRFAFLAKQSSSVSNDEPSVASSSASSSHTTGRAALLPRENRTALKTIWLMSAFLAIFMPILIRGIRMTTDTRFQQQQQQEEEGEYDGSSTNQATSPALHFVYAWQIVMFLVITVYGYNVIHGQKSHDTLMGALLVWWQSNLLAMLLLSDSIQSRGGMEMEVFYGQFPVLMFMTNAWYVVHGLIFCFLFAIRGVVSKHRRQQQQQAGPAAAAAANDEQASKKIHDTDHIYQRMDTPPSPTGSAGDGGDYIIVV
jgi:uncharacterized membrane protein